MRFSMVSTAGMEANMAHAVKTPPHAIPARMKKRSVGRAHRGSDRPRAFCRSCLCNDCSLSMEKPTYVGCLFNSIVMRHSEQWKPLRCCRRLHERNLPNVCEVGYPDRDRVVLVIVLHCL